MGETRLSFGGSFADDMRLEQRLSPRRNTMIEALIVFNGGRSMSVHHPHLWMAALSRGSKAVAGIPNSFDPLVPGNKPQACRVAWRALKEMGVQFI